VGLFLLAHLAVDLLELADLGPFFLAQIEWIVGAGLRSASAILCFRDRGKVEPGRWRAAPRGRVLAAKIGRSRALVPAGRGGALPLHDLHGDQNLDRRVNVHRGSRILSKVPTAQPNAARLSARNAPA
jgi:hypothetical protein